MYSSKLVMVLSSSMLGIGPNLALVTGNAMFQRLFVSKIFECEPTLRHLLGFVVNGKVESMFESYGARLYTGQNHIEYLIFKESR